MTDRSIDRLTKRREDRVCSSRFEVGELLFTTTLTNSAGHIVNEGTPLTGYRHSVWLTSSLKRESVTVCRNLDIVLSRDPFRDSDILQVHLFVPCRNPKQLVETAGWQELRSGSLEPFALPTSCCFVFRASRSDVYHRSAVNNSSSVSFSFLLLLPPVLLILHRKRRLPIARDRPIEAVAQSKEREKL